MIRNISYGLSFFILLNIISCGKEVVNPNIIIIYADDLGWADLGCYGAPYYNTPNLDKLASEGMKFTNAYANSAVCSPSRASLLTGRYPTRHEITTWIREYSKGSETDLSKHLSGKNKMLEPVNPFWMELDEITLAEVLKDKGYTTCHIGKWHLGPKKWYPDQQGFDFNIAGCDRGSPPGYFDPYRYENLPNLPTRRDGEYLTDRLTEEAAGFIRNHSGKPFFLYMSHYAVHGPWEAKEEVIDKYRNLASKDQLNPTYAAMVESMDQSCGKIIDLVAELGLSKNTLIIFSSDNGGVHGESNQHEHITSNAPLRAGKCWPYEGGIRVPTIFYWPGMIESNSISDVPIAGIDFFPTICALVGTELPTDRPIDGLNLGPVLFGDGHMPERDLYWHFPHYQNTTPYSVIRSGKWKLIKYYENNSIELFNIEEDIGEARNPIYK